MGGRSKKQTVGFRYSLGMHLALCHGPVDAIREILVDRRTAWSVTTGAGVSGGGAAVETRIGTVPDMAASAALAGDTGATITFPGTLAGIRLGQAYRLVLADGSRQAITVNGVTYDPASDTTSWSVQPDTLSFPAQSVEVLEATTDASNAGAGGGRIRIDKPGLFGGEKREGGIVGDIDVLMGGPGQGQNDYLAARMNGDVPGFRGLCSLVLRQVYLGINPYLKPWAVRVTRVQAGEAGSRAMVSGESAHRARGQHLGRGDLCGARCLGLDVGHAHGGAKGGRRGPHPRDRRGRGSRPAQRYGARALERGRRGRNRAAQHGAGGLCRSGRLDAGAVERHLGRHQLRCRLRAGGGLLHGQRRQAPDRHLRHRWRTLAPLVGRCRAGHHRHPAARGHFRVQHRALGHQPYRAHRQHARRRRAGGPARRQPGADRLAARGVRQRAGHEPRAYHPRVSHQPRLGSGLFLVRDRGKFYGCC